MGGVECVGHKVGCAGKGAGVLCIGLASEIGELGVCLPSPSEVDTVGCQVVGTWRTRRRCLKQEC